MAYNNFTNNISAGVKYCILSLTKIYFQLYTNFAVISLEVQSQSLAAFLRFPIALKFNFTNYSQSIILVQVVGRFVGGCEASFLFRS